MVLDGWFETVYVFKDIFLLAPTASVCEGCPDAAASTSSIKQGFIQTFMVPEPATLGMLGIGLTFLGVGLRRRRKTIA